ncbi:hypothetical protein GCM10027590_20180 [Nocardiopsis nanhaiensis]
MLSLTGTPGTAIGNGAVHPFLRPGRPLVSMGAPKANAQGLDNATGYWCDRFPAHAKRGPDTAYPDLVGVDVCPWNRWVRSVGRYSAEAGAPSTSWGPSWKPGHPT